MWGIIATWRMAAGGIEKVARILENDGISGDATETAIKEVEGPPYYKSVGYGGLSNEEMGAELDAVYTDGTTFDIGAVAVIEDFANPISIARRLSKGNVNNLLVGKGAEKPAHKEGFERRNMLNDRAKIHYKNRVKDVQELKIKPCSGYDTVDIVCLDSHGDMTVATLTSGLFMKKKGRVGDPPTSGSGSYVDSRTGGASATRLGEDLMKGCTSYEVARLMKEGKHPQEVCGIAVSQSDQEFTKRCGKAGDISLVAMNSKGEWGAIVNIEGLLFAVATQIQKPIVYVTKRGHEKCVHEEVSSEWLENYTSARMAPLIEKQHGR